MMFSTNLPLAPLDHVETFAGEMAVIIGEWQDWGAKGVFMFKESGWVASLIKHAF